MICLHVGTRDSQEALAPQPEFFILVYFGTKETPEGHSVMECREVGRSPEMWALVERAFMPSLIHQFPSLWLDRLTS